MNHLVRSSCLEQHRVLSSKLLEVVVCQWRGWELQLTWPACQLGLLGHVRRGLCSTEAGNWDANGAKGWRRPRRHCPGGRRLGQWAGVVYHVRMPRRAPTGFVPVCEVVDDFGSVYGGVTDQMDDPLGVGALVGHLWFGT